MVSVTAGTVFQDSHLPLRLWFEAMWMVTSQKNGASALTIQQVLGLGSYRTAWAMLHKLRHAMVRPVRDRLSGRVEVDETFVGGEEENVRGRQRRTKSLVVVAVEEDGRGVGRVRMRRIADASASSLLAFVSEAVEAGSIVRTDGWSGYVGLEAAGYGHDKMVLRGQGVSAAAEELPRIHLLASLLKRWLTGTHQGAVSAEHLDYYLDEFTFRFNRRTSRSRGKLFYRLAQQAVEVGPLPYNMILSRTGRRRRVSVLPESSA
jgi:transposase-like protein